MRLLTFITLLVLSMLSACGNDDDSNATVTDLAEGTITGPDFRKCSCCGGWFVEIDQEQWRFSEIPADSNFDIMDESIVFPVYVRLGWQPVSQPCMGDEIEVKFIEKI